VIESLPAADRREALICGQAGQIAKLTALSR
jgi:hypothetical protein